MRHEGFSYLIGKHIRKDKHLKDHILLLVLLSMLLSFSLIFVYSMADGIADKYAYLGSGHLTVKGLYSGVGDYPVRRSSALLYGTEKTANVMVKGVGNEYFFPRRLQEISIKTVDGMDLKSILTYQNRNASIPQILISRTLSEKLKLELGSKALIVIPCGGSFKPVLCTIGGIYTSGYEELDAQLIFCPITILQQYDCPLETEMLVDGDVRSEKYRLLENGYSVTAWYETSSAIAENLKTSQNVITGVFLVIALLASYFISEFSATLVDNRKKEIATLKLLGATDASLYVSYVASLFRISIRSLVVGTLIGITLSYMVKPLLGMLSASGIPALQYYLLSFSIRVPFARIFFVLVFLLICCMVSASLALLRIRKIQPISLSD